MDENAKKKLLKIARQAVKAAVSANDLPGNPVEDKELQGKQGCFVTLKNKDLLRGCIGRFRSDLPLYKLIREMAAAAATEDPRFSYKRITPTEVEDLTIEISVLSPLKKIDNPLDLELGVHGIYIQRGPVSGCFLPQVATETGWSKEEFLSNCCSGKAMLPPDSWKGSGTDVYLFTADVFGEEERDQLG